jgi:hypothetical protein
VGLLGEPDEAIDLLDRLVSFLFRGEPEAQIVLAVYLNSQQIVA